MDVSLLINGQDQAASSGKVFERRNPLSQEVASRAAAATASDADAAVAAASAAFAAWSALGPNARRALLLKAADALEAKRHAFVRIMMAEIGTTEIWSAFNVKLATGMLREAAKRRRSPRRSPAR
ncbi:acyl-CoA reductase-like NAD-dependent aldehyde dehydrogenase [Bradyrhizobium sp. GM22.5]